MSDLKKLLQENGVVGAGGAGFPSYCKLAEGADTLLINAVECEPLLYTSYTLLPEATRGTSSQPGESVSPSLHRPRSRQDRARPVSRTRLTLSLQAGSKPAVPEPGLVSDEGAIRASSC